jgi:hypothetical protein
MSNTLSIPEIKVVIGRSDIAELTAQAQELTSKITTIADEAECAHAREIMVEVNTLVKEIEDQRTNAKRPFLDTGKQIDALARKLSSPLEKCVTTLKIKLADYAMEIERKRIAADAARLRLEAQAKADAEQDGRTPALVTEVEVPEAAAVATTTVTDYIVDMDKLPKAYCMPDEQKIKAAIKAGLEVPGITVQKRKVVTAR